MTSPLRWSALAATAVLGLASLAGCGGGDDPGTDPSPASGTTATQEPTAEPTQEPTETASPTEPATETATEPAAGTTVPIYWVGETPQGPRLFREFRKVEGDPLTEAANLLAAGQPNDPDYRTEWPGGGFKSVQATDGLLVVEMPDDGWTTRVDGMSKQDARLAIQQLVYTLQGVQQARVPVQVLLGGQPTQLFGFDTAQPFKQAPQLDVLGLVNITSPEQGQTVSGDTLEASGVASSFEATVPWEIRQGDAVVLEGFSTAEGWMDRLYPWEAQIDVSSLAPGAYTFAALTDDPSGGAEGAGPHEDTRDFTLQ